MEDLVRLGGAIFGVLLLLLAALFVTTRLYIHSLKKWMLKAQGELQSLRAELESLNHRVNTGTEALEPVEKAKSA